MCPENRDIHEPGVVYWEIIDDCNLNCVHCRRQSKDDGLTNELPTKKAFAIVDQIVNMEKPVLVLTGGEPLFRPDIFDIATYGRKKGLQVEVTSNGSLIDRWMAKRIKLAGIQRVSIGLEGAFAETHDTIRGIEGAFDATLRGIKNLYDHGIPVQLNITVNEDNEDEIEQIFELAREKEVAALQLLFPNSIGCGLCVAEDQVISITRFSQTVNRIFEKSQGEPFEVRAICPPQPLQTMNVQYGVLQNYKYLPFPVSDCCPQSLQEIWEVSPAYAQSIR